MGRRKDHTRTELRDLILNAAWQIVGEEGLSALTARRIGTRVGYAPGTIYNIFPSMNSLTLHLNARTLDLLYKELSVFPRKEEGIVPAMKNMADCYIRFAVLYRPYWLALFTADLGDERREDSWYIEKIERLFIPLGTLLRNGFTEKTPLEISSDARILWSSVHGLTYLFLTGKLPLKEEEGQTLETLIHRLIDTYNRSE